MPPSRHSTGLLLVILAAIVGGVLVWLPPKLLEQYRAAQELSPVAKTIYLVSVGAGVVLLGGLTLWMLWRVIGATLRKRKSDERRSNNPSEMSATDQEHELRQNLSASEDWATTNDVPDDVRRELKQRMDSLNERLEQEKLEIVAFGTISSGKSSLLNAIAGRDLFLTDPVGGTTQLRNEVPWPGHDRVVLVDTPGLAEVHGERRATIAADAAKDADLILLVVDGPLKSYEMELLRQLGEMEKKLLVCLNKEDWYPPEQRSQLIEQIRAQTSQLVPADDVIAVRAGSTTRKRVRVLADGTETEETVAAGPDISPLAERMLELIAGSRRQLLLANLLLQSRGLMEQAKAKASEAVDRQADSIISKYMWAAGGAAAVNPIPLLDVAGGSAITVKMVVDLARVYRQEIDTDTVVQILANLSKNLIAMLGVTAATPAIVSVVASSIKTVPGIGTIAGGLVQGIVQALVTRWIGKVFCDYFRTGMKTTSAGLAEIARTKWQEVTRPEQIIKLVQAARRELTGKNKGEE